MGKQGERQHLTVVAGLDGFWATFTGGDTTREVTKVRDGGQKKADLILGDANTDDIVVGRPYDPGRDGPIYRRLKAILDAGGSFATQVTSTDTDADFVAVDEPRSYEVELKTLRGPEGNRESANPKKLELVFAAR